MASFTTVRHLWTFNIVVPLIYHFCRMLGRRRTQSARPSLLVFRIYHPIARISSSLVFYRSIALVLSLWRRVLNRKDSSRKHGGWSRMSHSQRRKTSVTATAVWHLALSWRMMGFCTTKCRRFPWALDEVGAAGTYSSRQRLPSACRLSH